MFKVRREIRYQSFPPTLSDIKPTPRENAGKIVRAARLRGPGGEGEGDDVK